VAGKRKRHAKKYELKSARALTVHYEGLTNRVVTELGLTPAFDPNDFPPDQMPYEITFKQALWDTGATGSVLTKATVKELNLTPTGITKVNHAGGSSVSNTYLVNLFLPNKFAVIGVTVSECDDIAGQGNRILIRLFSGFFAIFVALCHILVTSQTFKPKAEED
jgi:hypothetical protein